MAATGTKIEKPPKRTISKENALKMRDFFLKARSGEGPKPNEQQLRFARDLVDDGIVEESDIFPPLGTAQAVDETIKTTVGGAMEAAGGLMDILPEGPFGKSLIGQAGEKVQEAGRNLQINRDTLPETQKNLLGGANLVGATQIPANILIKSGKIISSSLNPVQLRQLGSFKRALVDASKNPRAFIKLESAIAAPAGITGEMLAEDFGELGRAFGELVTSFGLPLATRFVKGIGGIVKFRAGSEEEAKDVIGRYLSNEFDRDPLIRENLKITEDVQRDVPGTQFTLDQATKNPELAATAREVGLRGQTVAMDEKTKKSIIEFSNAINPKTTIQGRPQGQQLDKYQETVQSAVEKMETEHSNNIESILSQMTKSILKAGGQDEVLDIAEDARNLLTRSKTALQNAIRDGYNSLGDVPIRPEDVRGLLRSLSKATATQDPLKPLPDSVTSIAARLRNSFKGRRATTVQEPRGLDQALGAAPKTRQVPENLTHSRFLVLNEIDSSVSEAMREAGKSGKMDEVRRLGKIKSGINSVYETMSRRTDVSADKAVALKQLKKMRITMGKLYENAEIEVLFKKGRQGDFKIATEDIMDTFIRTGKRAFRAADYYGEIFKDIPEAQQLIRREFSRRLRASAMDPETRKIIPKKVIAFQKKYDDAIKAYGLEEDFKDIRTSIKYAEESIGDIHEDMADLKRQAFKSFADTNNPEGFIDSMVNEPAQIQRFVRGLEKNSMEFEGFKDLVVDRIIQKTSAGVAFGSSNIPGEHLFNLPYFQRLIADPKRILTSVLGKKHMKNLEVFATALGRAAPTSGAGAKASEFSKEIQSPKVRELLSGARAALRGFVRADFIVLQSSFKTAEAIASQTRRRILVQAMKDPKFAQDLVLAVLNKPLRGSLKSLFSPAAASALKGEDLGNDTQRLLDKAGFKGEEVVK